jgi:hypothetical protein
VLRPPDREPVRTWGTPQACKEAKEQTMSKIETVKTALDQDKRPLHDDELEAVCGGTLESNTRKQNNDTANAIIQKLG